MVTIRDAAGGDLPAILDLLTRSGLPDEDLDPGRATFLVAVLDGKIVGTIALESYPPDGLLRSAAVDARSRGRGIGRSLVAEILVRARREGLDRVVLLTTTAEEFFREAGFRKVERESLGGPVVESGQFRGSRCASAVVMTIPAAGGPPPPSLSPLS